MNLTWIKTYPSFPELAVQTLEIILFFNKVMCSFELFIRLLSELFLVLIVFWQWELRLGSSAQLLSSCNEFVLITCSGDYSLITAFSCFVV